MRVLITGSHGQIGTQLQKFFVGRDVFLVDKKIGKNLNDAETLIEIGAFNPEVVFHLAASFERTTESYEFDKLNWEDNILATHNLLSCIRPKQFVFASSYLVYNPDLYMNHRYDLRESAPIKPRNLCGASKLYLEKEIDFVGRRWGAQISHARIFRVYSKDSKCFINHFANTKKLEGSVNLWGAKAEFDFIHAWDVARALFVLAGNEGTFNVGTGIRTSVQKVVDLIGVETRQAEEPEEIEHSCADISAMKELGWEPKIKIETGIKEILECEIAPL